MSGRPMFPKPDSPFSRPLSGLVQQGHASPEPQAQSQAVNSVELRVKMALNARLRQRAYLVPPPLHDFTKDDASSSEDFDQASEYYALTGVGGKRLLRAKDQIPPQAGCQTDEEFWKHEQLREPLPSFARHDQHGVEVYRSTFQDLSPETPESVMQQLETHPDPQMAMRPFYTPVDEKDETLVFESRFESGNLYSASKIGSYEYDLVLQNDTNTSGHTQWYFFSVSNTRMGQSYKFNVTNLLKPQSLYNAGLRPLLLSTKGKEESELIWKRAGSDIRYCNNAQKRKGVFQPQADPHWTLSFTINFEHSFDTCYLAHCYPYTYRDLQVYLHEIGKNPDRRKYVSRRRLCETEAGNACDLLTVTAGKEGTTQLESRKGVVITARIHPGEMQASWMVQGLIDFLSSEDPQAAELRDRFVFKIVPMLNPDGVINGNYRCCLAGNDLNRRWDRPDPRHHSTITATKDLIQHFMKEHEVVLFLDLHGHSNKKDVFTYGNDQRTITERFPATTLPHGGPHETLSERIFPFLLQESVPSFAYSKCSFKVQRAKLSTGRVVCAREFGLVNAYTLEASFSGDAQTEMHFDIPQLQLMGRGICLAVLACFSPDVTVRNSVLEKLRAMESGVFSEEENSEDSSSADEGEDAEGPKKISSQGIGSGKAKRSASLEDEARGRSTLSQESDESGEPNSASRERERGGADEATRSRRSSFVEDEGGAVSEGRQQKGVDTKNSGARCAGKGGTGTSKRHTHRSSSHESVEDFEDDGAREAESVECRDSTEHGVGDTHSASSSSDRALQRLSGFGVGAKQPKRLNTSDSKARPDKEDEVLEEGLLAAPLSRHSSTGPSGDTTPSSRRPLSAMPNLRKAWVADGAGRKAPRKSKSEADGVGAVADVLRPPAAKGHRLHVQRGALTARGVTKARPDDFLPVVTPSSSAPGDSFESAAGLKTRKGLRVKRKGGLGKRSKSVDANVGHVAMTATVDAKEHATAQDQVDTVLKVWLTGNGTPKSGHDRGGSEASGPALEDGASNSSLDLRLGCKRTDKHVKSEVHLLEKLRASHSRLVALSQASSRTPRQPASLMILRSKLKHSNPDVSAHPQDSALA